MTGGQVAGLGDAVPAVVGVAGLGVAGVVAAAVVAVAVVAAALLVRRPARARPAPTASGRRILFPFVGDVLSRAALDATLRIARAEGATLVPAFLARVPLNLPLDTAVPYQCDMALPLLEVIEQRARAAGVPVDGRIERGRTYRHAVRELIEHERFDRLVFPAAADGADGFGAADVAWMLDHAPGEIVVLRPAQPRGVKALSAAS